ncbi:CPBP family intramembrane glutamic endopeptidase [Actinomadura hibisca]|uniref:CPBP family intramembrane glutamic endopeptidase n=1 Tax=Actinomadura hibisca TaxID=68565 RepID=UPI000830A703|nr:type II CAAX endopeptidase family protein [Actinomadura hibisca]
MRLLKQLLPVVLVAFVGGQVVVAVEDSPVLSLVIGLMTAVLAVLVYAWTVRWSEHRAPVEVAVRGATTRTLLGVLIGAGWFAAVIGNIAFNGGYRVEGFGEIAGPVGLVGFMAAASVTEELMFRGVLFRITEERLGTWWSLVLTSVLFGLWHMLNPDATLWGAVAIAISAGGTLAAAYAAFRTLWVPIGLHFGWNFAQGGVFGTAVSGNGENDGLLDGVLSGPAILTGGKFGPEASPHTVLSGVILTVVFLWLARRRGTLVRRKAEAPAPAASLAR